MQIEVAVGVIVKENKVLIAKRAIHQHQGNLWEFPGGKIHSNETAIQALKRELAEEVQIIVQQADELMTIEHHYLDKAVKLHVYLVKEFSGIAKGLESQPIKWVAIDKLKNYEFPVANQAIIERLS